ncbi:MAG: hypothetical protein IPI93_14350 [Sphingobacteriaceae bacterium]|nr:hypothetical protein [Sphingobacteriaceae bacterium]MBK7819063.1 hypothetical protein [Sphingobacteriaceae bacterium]
MENKKSILAGSVIASAIIGLSSISANASTLTNYSALGSGAEVRTILLGKSTSPLGAFELKCGGKDSTATKDGKGKDGKCGEGKCGDKKKDAKAKDGKGKDGKCGEGKCGDGKKKDKKDPK